MEKLEKKKTNFAFRVHSHFASVRISRQFAFRVSSHFASVRISRYKAFSSATNFVNTVFASPNNIFVLGLKKSSFSIPA